MELKFGTNSEPVSLHIPFPLPRSNASKSTSLKMDRYQRVEKPHAEAPIKENEIRITSQGRIRNYITYAMSLLQEKDSNDIIIKAMGRAINKTVMIVELIKRRIAGLHQNTSIESANITDMWEPLEEGLLPLETTRHVSVITITLSKKELDTSSAGYQPPIPADQVKPLAGYNDEGEPLPGRRGRRHGGRGRGRGRGTSSEAVDHYDGGWDDEHGYNNRGRGHERGYSGKDTQQESGGYDDIEPDGIPSQGRGRGRRGKGRGRGRGRGRGDSDGGALQADA